MSWENINFDTLITGCITTGYKETTNRLSMVEVLNTFIDAINEKNYAVNWTLGSPSLIQEANRFEEGSITFNEGFEGKFNLLLSTYWQLWSRGWYSSGAMSDIVNYTDYLMDDTDLINATSQEFHDIISDVGSATFQEKWSEVVFQNLYLMYDLMKFHQLPHRSPNDAATKSGQLYYGQDDEGFISGSQATPAPHGINTECVPWIETSLPPNLWIDALQTQAYNSAVSAKQPDTLGSQMYDLDWYISSGVSDFYNRRTDRVEYDAYKDKNVIYVNMKKYSTDEFLDNIPFAYSGEVFENSLFIRKSKPSVDGGGSDDSTALKDANYPAKGEFFDLIDKMADSTFMSVDYGFGTNVSYENAAIPNLVATDNPPNLCQNTSGQYVGYFEGHLLDLRGVNFGIVDSNNPALDYYIAPDP